MNIVVVLRQVPDLIEPLEVDSSGTALDWGAASFILNESDDHALEQALLLKEGGGGTITVVALEFGEVDNALYAAAAKGADRLIKIPLASDVPPPPQAAAAMYAAAIAPVAPLLVLVGVQAHDELDGILPPLLAARLGMPYVGVIRGVKAAGAGAVVVRKEFPGAVSAQMQVQLPAVLGILGAEQPPRYVPVSRIRAAMKSAQLDEQEVPAPDHRPAVEVCRFYPPAVGAHAAMLSGSESEVAARIVEILAEKGLV